MIEEKDRQIIIDIIHDEIEQLFKQDRYVFTKLIQIADGRNIQVGKTTGTKIGTETTQKLAFFGNDPVAQQTAVSSPSGGVTVDSAARAAIDDIITKLENLGLIAEN